MQARLSELQAEAAKSAEVTVASLLGELEDARVRATSLNQLGAVVKSISEKAKISGLLTTKIEITDHSGGTDRFNVVRTRIAGRAISTLRPEGQTGGWWTWYSGLPLTSTQGPSDCCRTR